MSSIPSHAGLPCYQHPYLSGTFVTIDDLCWHIIIFPSSLLCCIFYGFEQIFWWHVSTITVSHGVASRPSKSSVELLKFEIHLSFYPCSFPILYRKKQQPKRFIQIGLKVYFWRILATYRGWATFDFRQSSQFQVE